MYFFRFFYDLLFFIVVNVIVMNIVFGIIIDAFAGKTFIIAILSKLINLLALRDQKSKTSKDKRNICFICGLSRPKFDNLKGFEFHVETEHNTWNYMFFIYNMRIKKKSNLRGLEVYIHKAMSDIEVSWVPMGRSKSISERDHLDIDFKLDIVASKLKVLDKIIEKKLLSGYEEDYD